MCSLSRAMGNVLRGLFAPAKSKEKDAVEVFDGGMDEMDSDDEMPDIGRLNDESESPRDGKPSTAVIVQNTRKRSSWSFSRSKKPAPIRPSGADDGAGAALFSAFSATRSPSTTPFPLRCRFSSRYHAAGCRRPFPLPPKLLPPSSASMLVHVLTRA